MQNIKIQLNKKLELSIPANGFHIIRCDCISSFEILDYPDELCPTTIFYSFPNDLHGFCHVMANEIFDWKVKTGHNIGKAIINNIEEKYLNGFNLFFVNPVGIDAIGVAYILDYMEQKLQSSNMKISFVLFLNYVDYHSYFEDDAIIMSSAGKRKKVFQFSARE